MQKNGTVDHYLAPHPKMNSKLIKLLHVRLDATKLLKENLGNKLLISVLVI